MHGSSPCLSLGSFCAWLQPQMREKSVSQSVLVNSTLFWEFLIRAYIRLRARVGPGPFWVVVWVHMEGQDCSQHQQGLFFFRSLRFPLGRCPAKWAWAAVEDKSPIEGYFLIRGFSSRMPQLTSPELTKPHACKCTGSSYIAKTMFSVDVRPAMRLIFSQIWLRSTGS